MPRSKPSHTETKLKLLTRRVEKPWGRDALPAPFGGIQGRPIGEIWYEDPARPELPLLPKFLFTSQKLSIQVHPSGEQAGIPGVRGVRAECWYIVEAEDDACVGYGFQRAVSPAEVRSAALAGSLENLLTWHSVRAGDFIFVPSGAVHAIGAGLTIVEFQQSYDVTYRLFDYARGRPLQLQEALAAASFDIADPVNIVRHPETDDSILVSSPQFTVAKVHSPSGAAWMLDRQRWVMPLSGQVQAEDTWAQFGDCLLVDADQPLKVGPGTVALIAVDGPIASH
jgi:mannose-6-phosphate isomerase